MTDQDLIMTQTLRQAIRYARSAGGNQYLIRYTNGWRVQPASFPRCRASLYVSAAGFVYRISQLPR